MPTPLTQGTPVATKTKMLVAIASNIENSEVLIAGVLPGAEILLLNDSQDSIAQISRALAANPAQTLSILCHGSSGKLDLGNAVLDHQSLPEYQSQLQAWGISELVLYACEVGQDRNFIAQLSEQTGASVISAQGKVGNAALGGSWQLKDGNGEILEALVFNQQARQTYTSVLVSFATQTNFATGAYAASVAVGDFNGDGKLDLAVANYGSANVSVLLGNGSGSFSAQTTFAVGSRPVFVAVGDFNNDGKPDLVVANSNSDNVSVLLGTGSGGFSAGTGFPTRDQPFSVAVGDFNGDGKSDLAVANGNDSSVSVLLGTGSGGFGAQSILSVGNSPRSMVVSDFNGDGKLDLAVANRDSNNWSVRLGNGSGGFGAQTNFGSENSPVSLAVGDFNGDVKPDVVVANQVTNNVSVLLGTGSGSFGTRTNFETGSGPASVAVGDFDGDGKLDLAVANQTSNNVSVLLGNGSGSFSTQTTFATGNLPFSVAVGDFNGDGKPDLAVANLGTNNVSVLLNNTDTTAPTVTDIDDGDADNNVIVGDTLTYTITFSEDINAVSVTTADFDNAGTATIGIGTITETTPGVFTVQVTPSTIGTVILRIPSGAVISDVAGNNLVVPVQDGDTVTVNPVPGITVNPTSGLVTTEAGGTATFTVALTSQPTADVTISISSSNTAEGTASPTSLTFTSANFSTPQTVTVIGVDDFVADGNVAYNIITGAATSADTNYNNFNPADVSVTNQDNDTTKIPTPGTTVVPSGGGNLILGTNLANVIFGTATNDTMYGYAGDDFITGQNGLDYIDGGIGNDTLLGDAGNDTLIGGAGNDTLIGGLGADNLIGGAEIDVFVYNAIAEGGDIISDFAVTEKFLVSQGGFGGGLLPGILLASQFGSGAGLSTAANSAQRFIYDTTSGILRFDVDGSGLGASSIIATLSNKPALSSSNFQVF
jgi:Ca2+-binding RTX toxin-like protein